MAKVALVHNLKKPKSKKCADDYYSEFDSPKTVEAIALAIRMKGHTVFLVEADENLFDWLRLNPVDIVFNIAEGISGESSRESQVPAMLDFLGIPYTGSGVLALALSLNKARAKHIFISNGIPTPAFQLFKKGARPFFENQRDLHFPLIVKPNCEGSSKGIHISNLVRNKARLYEEIDKIRQFYQQDVLVEEYVDGRELTVGILGNEEPKIFPILEIDFTECQKKGELFYSWEVKEYQGKDSRCPDPDFFCPARLTKEEEERVREVALKAHSALGCLDVSRVDIRLKGLVPFVLEVNSLPGLDPEESNLTCMAEASGMNYSDLINEILESALKRYGLKKSPGPEALKEGVK